MFSKKGELGWGAPRPRRPPRDFCYIVKRDTIPKKSKHKNKTRDHKDNDDDEAQTSQSTNPKTPRSALRLPFAELPSHHKRKVALASASTSFKTDPTRSSDWNSDASNVLEQAIVRKSRDDTQLVSEYQTDRRMPIIKEMSVTDIKETSLSLPSTSLRIDTQPPHTESLSSLHRTSTATGGEKSKQSLPLKGQSLQSKLSMYLDSIEPEKKEEKDRLTRIIGGWGKFQLLMLAALFLAKYTLAHNELAILIFAPKTSYLCLPPGTPQLQNPEYLENITINSCPCGKHLHNRTRYKNTMVHEWDLICTRRFMIGLNQAIYYLGELVGSFVFGISADRFGRKIPLIISVVIQFSSGIAAAFSGSFRSFSLCRFVLGLATGGVTVTSFVLCLEYAGTAYREYIAVVAQMPYVFGLLSLPAYGYFLDGSFKHIQLAMAIVSVFQLAYIYVAPESARWLIAMKKTERAIKTLEYIAKLNKRPHEHVREEVESYQSTSKDQKQGHIYDLFRTPNLKREILACSCVWFSCYFTYIGLWMSMGRMSFRIYWTMTEVGICSLITTLVLLSSLSNLSRVGTVIGCSFLTVVCAAIMSNSNEYAVALTSGTLGTMSSFVVYTVVFLYTSELFPTVVRNSALGYCYMLARIGAILAPVNLHLRVIWEPYPLVVMSAVAFSCVIITLVYLPETRDIDLMTTLEEGESFGVMERSIRRI